MSDNDTRTVPKLRYAIAEEVRVLLARKRMSATELARQLGWSQPYISRRMVGDQAFDADDMEAIAEALGVEAKDLLPGPRRRYASLEDLNLKHPPHVTLPPRFGPTPLALQRATDNAVLAEAV